MRYQKNSTLRVIDAIIVWGIIALVILFSSCSKKESYHFENRDKAEVYEFQLETEDINGVHNFSNIVKSK